MSWRDWLGIGKKKEEPPTPAPEAPERFPWVDFGKGSWRTRALDVRAVTWHMLSSSGDPSCAENLLAMGRSDGREFADAEVELEREVPGGLSYPVLAPLAPGVLFSPEAMEDKWAIFLQADRILFVRSWTRRVMLSARISWTADRLVLERLRGAFVEVDEAPAFTRAVADALIRTHVAGEEWPVPVLPGHFDEGPEVVAMACMQLYGRRAALAVPHGIDGPPLGAPLRTRPVR